MATSTVKRVCFTCGKQKIVYSCAGCSKQFCMDDLTKHNQFIAEQFDAFQNECDQFRQEFIERKEDSKKYSSMQQINQWEEDSIKKIKATANDCRDILVKEINKHIMEIETKLNELTEKIRAIHRENEYNEIDLHRLTEELKKLTNELDQSANMSVREDSTPFISKISIVVNSRKVTDDTTKLIPKPNSSIPQASAINVDIRAKNVTFDIAYNAQWVQNGATVAGGNGAGMKMNQLQNPSGLYVDEDRAIFIADSGNHRIVHWKTNATSGRVIAGGNGRGKRIDQLSDPTDVIVDKETNSLIICDSGNERIMRWPLQSGTTMGEILLENINCSRLTMDDQRCIYISSYRKNEVSRYRMGEQNSTLIIGNNGRGNRLNQLNGPTYIFVDHEYSVYVSDNNNHRVMKWAKEATEGIVVAGGRGQGNSFAQLSNPLGIFIDVSGTVYVADQCNHRVTSWRKGATQGKVIVGENEQGKGANQLYYPDSLCFDQNGHLYVVDSSNQRVQRFSIEMN